MSEDEPPTKKKKIDLQDPNSSDEEGDEEDFELDEFDEETEESSQQDGKNNFEFTKDCWFRPEPKKPETLRKEEEKKN